MTPPPIPRKTLAVLVALFALAGCQPGQNGRPVPSVAQIGGDLKCVNGDHGFEDPQAGWGFCYPGTWKYTVKAQTSASPAPAELDLAFDIVNDPCGKTGCDPSEGLFGFMILSTYDRAGVSSLSDWLAANLKGTSVQMPITWGNADEAVQLSDGRRVALTPHHVVIMDLHPGPLDLEAAMSTRLETWRFEY